MSEFTLWLRQYITINYMCNYRSALIIADTFISEISTQTFAIAQLVPHFPTSRRRLDKLNESQKMLENMIFCF